MDESFEKSHKQEDGVGTCNFAHFQSHVAPLPPKKDSLK